ncbi:MAG: YCF48-related protein [bacterium]
MTYTMRIFGVAAIAFMLALATFVSSVQAAGWVLQDTGAATGNFYDVVHLTSSKAVAVGWAGQAYYTSNSGKTWTAGASGVPSMLYGVDSESIASVVAVGAGGTIITSADEGATWTARASGTTYTLFDVDMLTTSFGMAVGESGTVLTTSDGGVTWTARTSGTSYNLLGVYVVSSGTAWAVGDSGRIIKTTNGGISWSPYSGSTSKSLQDVNFISALVGYIVGESGTIIKTTDGGANWNAVSVTGLGTEDIYSFEALTSSILGFVGDDILFISEDGGSTWTKTAFTGDDLRGLSWTSLNSRMVVGRDSGFDAIIYSYDAYAPDAPVNLTIDEGSPTNQTSPTLSWDAATDDESEIDHYMIKIDEDIWNSVSGTSYPITWTLSEGLHGAYIYAVDQADNESDIADLYFTIDITDPVIPAVTPTSATVGTAVTFVAAPEDDYGVAECDLYVDSIYKGDMVDVGDGNFQMSYTFLTDGTHLVYARCTDEANNVNNGTTTLVSVSYTSITCYPDTDGDGYGNGSHPTVVTGTVCPSGSVSNGSDSCDGDASAHTYAQCYPATPTVPAVGTTDTGNLIKMQCEAGNEVNDPCRAVYYYGDDGKRHAFPNEKVYFTWYDNFDGVIIVTDEFMASISLGRNITYHPGTKMVKFQTMHTVYAVSAGGVLRAIASESVAQDLYGTAWNQQIDDISDAFYRNYSFGDGIYNASSYNIEAERASVSNINDDLDA